MTFEHTERPESDRLEELLAEIVQERTLVIEAEQAQRERSHTIVTEFKERNRLVINAAKAARRLRGEQ